jgi:hypothetical protein
MQIETMDRASVKLLGEKAEQALAELADSMGVAFSKQNGKFDPIAGTYTFKGEFSLEGSGQAKFERDVLGLPTSGLKADDYGREFNAQGKRFKIIGINLRAPKYPIEVTCFDDGKSYKFRASQVRLALASSQILGVA